MFQIKLWKHLNHLKSFSRKIWFLSCLVNHNDHKSPRITKVLPARVLHKIPPHRKNNWVAKIKIHQGSWRARSLCCLILNDEGKMCVNFNKSPPDPSALGAVKCQVVKKSFVSKHPQVLLISSWKIFFYLVKKCKLDLIFILKFYLFWSGLLIMISTLLRQPSTECEALKPSRHNISSLNSF